MAPCWKTLLNRSNRWLTLAALAWGTTLAGIAGRFIAKPERMTGFKPYWVAAHHWLAKENLYTTAQNKGFVYSPFAAVCLTPFAALPSGLANASWRVLGAAFLLAGLWSLMRYGPFQGIPQRLRGIVYLLVLPLSLSNLDSGQANLLVSGLIMLGVSAAYAQHWMLAAAAVSVATYWKIYPLAVGMLLCLLAPWRFGWRLALNLFLFALIPFMFQGTNYVADQYHHWIATRTADNRLEYALAIAPRDLWFLLVRLGHLPISQTAYNILRLAAAAAIAGHVLRGRWMAWPAERVYAGLFALVCCWMVLLGPATEWLTYVLLAPAVALGVVESFGRGPAAARGTVAAAYALLLFAAAQVAFAPRWEAAWLLAVLPVAGLVFAVFCGLYYGWPRSPRAATSGASPARD